MNERFRELYIRDGFHFFGGASVGALIGSTNRIATWKDGRLKKETEEEEGKEKRGRRGSKLVVVVHVAPFSYRTRIESFGYSK